MQIIRDGEVQYLDVDSFPHRTPPEVVKEAFKLISSDIGYIGSKLSLVKLYLR